jgi:hypothetical protein
MRRVFPDILGTRTLVPPSQRIFLSQATAVFLQYIQLTKPGDTGDESRRIRMLRNNVTFLPEFQENPMRCIIGMLKSKSPRRTVTDFPKPLTQFFCIVARMLNVSHRLILERFKVSNFGLRPRATMNSSS